MVAPIANDCTEDQAEETSTAGVPQLRRSVRTKKPTFKILVQDLTSRRRGMHTTVIDFQFGQGDDSEPYDYQEAMAHPRSTQWLKGVAEELTSMKTNHTYKILILPVSKREIPCRWVFKAKRDANGQIIRYKAGLVAKGYAQQYGINYEETYALTAKFDTLCVLLALAVFND